MSLDCWLQQLSYGSAPNSPTDFDVAWCNCLRRDALSLASYRHYMRTGTAFPCSKDDEVMPRAPSSSAPASPDIYDWGRRKAKDISSHPSRGQETNIAHSNHCEFHVDSYSLPSPDNAPFMPAIESNAMLIRISTPAPSSMPFSPRRAQNYDAVASLTFHLPICPYNTLSQVLATLDLIFFLRYYSNEGKRDGSDGHQG